ncbi:Cardiolipin synthase (CMP-forming), mitochondrial [Zea mays]|uniref:Cardiolipin synthase (CMP-forming), mitochondrial n=1 Tax=Zea mays TaxID=4577 RepID=A0A3L6ESD1_MAIZE|nr:Cardiolipin synthase (CMP-forming), mitochondrial [Zea mays]
MAADATNKRPRVSAFFLLDGSRIPNFIFSKMCTSKQHSALTFFHIPTILPQYGMTSIIEGIDAIATTWVVVTGDMSNNRIKNHALLLQTQYTSFGFYWALLFIPAYKFFAFYMEGPWAAMTTTDIFLAAAVTDWLDGYIARKMQLGTPFGAFLDNSNKYRHCRSSADIARASSTIPLSVSMSSSGSIGPSRIDRAAAPSGRSGHRRTRRTGPPWTPSTTTTTKSHR